MKVKEVGLFAFGLFIFGVVNLMAQEAANRPSESIGKWLNKEEIHLRDELEGYSDLNPAEYTQKFTGLAETLERQFDFNEMVRERMAWDRNLSSERSYLDRCRLSVGMVKAGRLLGGAMLKVELNE